MSENVKRFFEYKRMQKVAEEDGLLDFVDVYEYILNDIFSKLTDAEKLEITQIKQLLTICTN